MHEQSWACIQFGNAVVAATLWATAAAAADATASVKKVLEQSCLGCHNSTIKTSGLSLATVSEARKGGRRGAALVPGNPEESLLMRMISGEKPKMPPYGAPLTPEEVAQVRAWIFQGAPWPDGLNVNPRNTTSAPEWWSLKPLSPPQPPAVESEWIRTPVDGFIVSKLKEKGLTPSPEADRRALIRRLTYDLHGLPPAPEDIDAFAADRSPDAYQKLVDGLLASPRYGERWGRHWLDVVHYGESHGYDKDKQRPHAWPYRDFVIRSFNDDMPYSRFVKEQLAGDVLYRDDPDGVIGTGFIAAGPWDYVGHVELREGTMDKKITRLLDRDDMVATTMSTFVSLTAHCARCHDHKFDPISQEDYYSLQAVFSGVDRADRPFDLNPKVAAQRRPLLDQRRAIQRGLQPLLEIEAQTTSPEVQKIDGDLRALGLERANLQAGESERRKDIQSRFDRLTQERKDLVHSLLDSETRAAIDGAMQKLAAVDRQIGALPKPELVYAATSFFDRQANFTPAWQPRVVQVLNRGNVEAPGKPAQPGTVSGVRGLPSRFEISDPNDEGARRAALAEWITDPRNPLTWRSIVNRVWEYHFGAGIVDTPSDFGRMGSKPTHPELLDWLAVWFRDNGGSLKKLHRLIVTSAVYRQSSRPRPECMRIDADNRYLWRMNARRLEAEAVRDATLQISGKLDLTMGGPSVQQFYFKDDHSPVYDYTRFDVDSPASFRRSVYRFIVRSVPDPFMDSLDCPDASLLTPKRNVTLTAIQALAMLNNPFMVKQAEYFADRVQNLALSLPERIAAAYRLALGRAPRPDETEALAAYAAQYGLANACRLILNSNEFLFID
ncbi:MAG: PSD1 domain-containing protein [Acidobacteria bacterium]|nr:PSD1 domain-containing protein [Acidobacteriota bacterium]